MMGTGASTVPETGVSVNPRVEYAGELAKRDGVTDKKIDAPILVKMEHGTVRYRYQNEAAQHKVKAGRVERPHEGPERNRKHGYFFHSTLNDFSEDAAYSKEQDWKFRYVYKGPNKTRQKKLFYVFGKGLNLNKSDEPGIVRPGPAEVNRPTGVGYSWSPPVYKIHGHIYFNLTFVKQDAELVEADDEEADITDAADVSGEPRETEMQLDSTDRLERVCRRLSVRLLKPPSHIHVFPAGGGNEIRADQVVGELRTDGAAQWKRFKVLLRPR